MFLPDFTVARLDESGAGGILLDGVFSERAGYPMGERGADESRLRLVRVHMERRPAGRSRVAVEFEGPWLATPLVCELEGTTCPGGDLRLAARATLDVLTRATNGALHFDLIGVKPSRAFDTNLMLVAIMVHQGATRTKVLGVAVDENNTGLATVRATLHAVNRFVSPVLGSIPAPE